MTGNAKEPHDPGPPVVAKRRFAANWVSGLRYGAYANFASMSLRGWSKGFWGGRRCSRKQQGYKNGTRYKGKLLASQLHPGEKAVTLFLVETA